MRFGSTGGYSYVGEAEGDIGRAPEHGWRPDQPWSLPRPTDRPGHPFDVLVARERRRRRPGPDWPTSIAQERHCIECATPPGEPAGDSLSSAMFSMITLTPGSPKMPQSRPRYAAARGRTTSSLDAARLGDARHLEFGVLRD